MRLWLKQGIRHAAGKRLFPPMGADEERVITERDVFDRASDAAVKVTPTIESCRATFKKGIW